MGSEHDTEQLTLRQGDEKYRSLLDALSHGVQECDCEGVITYTNRAHHEILGCAEGELLGAHIWDMQPTIAEQEKLRQYLATLVREQPPPEPYMTTCRRKDGALVDLQVDWSYDRDADGTLRGFISVITDCTERKQNEVSLLRRTQGLATLLEVSRSFVETLELQGVLQAAVDGAARLVGLDTAAVYLLEGQALVLWATTPALPPGFPAALRRAPLAGHPHARDVITTGSPLLVADIKEERLTPEERDITEQRDLRTLLYLPLIADDEALGALIVGSVGKPSPISDPVIGLTQALANLAALAVKNSRLYEAGQRSVAQLERALADQKRGEQERESLQAQLAQARKLESVGRLAGGVAHDFNNMLTVILGHSELALLQVGSDDPVRDDLEEILEAGKRSANLTKQLLAFARKQTVAPRVLDLNETIEGMLRMLRRLIGEDIDLAWLPGSGLWRVHIDPGQVDQILVNLCINARDAIGGVGRIAIETSNLVLDAGACEERPALAPGAFVRLAVSDSGCGMEAETLERLFEPYFTTKDAGQGVGLGLATVYGIVKQNEGLIDVRSEPDRGTTLEVYLPRHATAPGGLEEKPASEPLTGGEETVLLVEDEPAVLDMGRRMLELLGYAVLAASTPSEAIRRAGEHPGAIHLLLTDLVMPEMSGTELARRLGGSHPEVRHLFTSGYAARVAGRGAALPEGCGFIGKPFSLNELAEKVREALDR